MIILCVDQDVALNLTKYNNQNQILFLIYFSYDE